MLYQAEIVGQAELQALIAALSKTWDVDSVELESDRSTGMTQGTFF